MQRIVFIFAVLLGIGSIYWFSTNNIFEDITEEITTEKEISK